MRSTEDSPVHIVFTPGRAGPKVLINDINVAAYVTGVTLHTDIKNGPTATITFVSPKITGNTADAIPN